MKQDLILKLIEMLVSSESETSENSTKEQDVNIEKGRYIVLGNRGNTVVGDLSIIGGTGYLKNASVIRVWGTTKGLGQLALEGKQESTKLDPCGEFEFELLTTCGMIPVKGEL